MEIIKSRVFKDNRKLSRVVLNMECLLESDGRKYNALMVDLSQGGALLSTTLLLFEDIPETQSKVSVTLKEGDILKAPLVLEGTIRRSSIGISEFGKEAKLGIEFKEPPLALLRLIRLLYTKCETT